VRSLEEVYDKNSEYTLSDGIAHLEAGYSNPYEPKPMRKFLQIEAVRLVILVEHLFHSDSQKNEIKAECVCLCAALKIAFNSYVHYCTMS